MRRSLFVIAVLALVGVGSAVAATTPPRSTAPPTVSGAARQGETFTADPGTWSGTQPLTFTYQWRRCDTSGNSCANIIGATSKTYVLTSVDVGNTLRVVVRASNDAGSRTASSAQTVVVAVKAVKSIRLDTSRPIVAYGAAATLTGSVANGEAGESVTIMEHRLPSTIRTVLRRAVATVRTASDGAFSLTVRPVVHTLYDAAIGQTSSNVVSVNVRPRLLLRRIGPHRFVLRALAARSFTGRFGLLQRWSARTQRWISFQRVFFARALAGSSPTIESRAVFRTRRGVLRVRVLLTQGQAGSGYVSGSSNSVRG